MACRGRTTIIDACQSPERRAPIVHGTITRVDEKKGRTERQREKQRERERERERERKRERERERGREN
jgi:hypothetical protein